VTQSSAGPRAKSYDYDQLYRLIASAGLHKTNPNEVSTYSYAQTYDGIHNITRKNQRHEFESSDQPDTTYDYTFTYPPSGSAQPHGAAGCCGLRSAHQDFFHCS
jgi:hypothetical protein